jgi:hypothetical protein
VDKIEKLVIAEDCRRSNTKARIAMNVPMMRMDTYGVPNLGWIFAMVFGICPFLAIANETRDKPNKVVKRTLTVAIKAPKETTPTKTGTPTTLVASTIGELDCAKSR